MLLKKALAFSSLGVVALAPYFTFKTKNTVEIPNPLANSLGLVFGSQEQIQDSDKQTLSLKDFFETNCKRINETMVVCKAEESLPWPELYYVEKQEKNSLHQKIKSFIFKFNTSSPILELELENGERKTISSSPISGGAEYFDSEVFVPEVDCVTQDGVVGGGTICKQ